MNGNNTYQERNSISYNKGEDIFLEYCRDRGLEVTRLGFDEKNASVSRFYDLSPFIRNLPDFIVTNGSKIILVNVKGSLNLKEQEFELLEGFAHLYESEHAKLYYTFCLSPSNIIWETLQNVSQAYLQETEIKEWPDGKRYKTLGIG